MAKRLVGLVILESGLGENFWMGLAYLAWPFCKHKDPFSILQYRRGRLGKVGRKGMTPGMVLVRWEH